MSIQRWGTRGTCLRGGFVITLQTHVPLQYWTPKNPNIWSCLLSLKVDPLCKVSFRKVFLNSALIRLGMKTQCQLFLSLTSLQLPARIRVPSPNPQQDPTLLSLHSKRKRSRSGAALNLLLTFALIDYEREGLLNVLEAQLWLSHPLPCFFSCSNHHIFRLKPL